MVIIQSKGIRWREFRGQVPKALQNVILPFEGCVNLCVKGVSFTQHGEFCFLIYSATLLFLQVNSSYADGIMRINYIFSMISSALSFGLNP